MSPEKARPAQAMECATRARRLGYERGGATGWVGRSSQRDESATRAAHSKDAAYACLPAVQRVQDAYAGVKEHGIDETWGAVCGAAAGSVGGVEMARTARNPLCSHCSGNKFLTSPGLPSYNSGIPELLGGANGRVSGAGQGGLGHR